MNKESLADRLEGLLARQASGFSKDQLRLEAPLHRNLPLRRDACVQHRIVVL